MDLPNNGAPLPTMELHFPSFPLLLTLSLFLLILIKIITKPTAPNGRPPPGPWQLPVIGSMHHLIGRPPHHILRDLARKHGPVMQLKLGQVDLVVLSSPEAAEAVTKTRDLNFANRPALMAVKISTYGYTDIAFAPYGAYWRQLRKICVLELLSAKRIKTFSSLREEEASALVASISAAAAADSPANLTKMLFSSNNTMISRAAFGKKCKQHERFISTMMEQTHYASGFMLADLFPSVRFIDAVSGLKSKLIRAHRQMDKILSEIIEDRQMITKDGRRRDESEENILDALLRIKDHGGLEIPLTLNNIKAVISDLFVAGTDTSSSTLEWAMSELMRNPEAMEKAQGEVRSVLKGKVKIEDGDIGELHYLKLVIKEAFRLHPPLPLLVPRVCGETCEIDGCTIQEGSRVVVNVWALARDPRFWDDPESFKPERFNGSSVDLKGNNFEFLPFGAGRRMCPGIAFGLASMEAILAHLLYYFNWELPGGMKPEDVDMAESFGATVRRKNDLCLLATPYVSSTVV